jgi:hypothetical protein
MKILIACEESQEVCKAFRRRGHEAYSCDIEPCSGGHPEWHLQQDVTELLKEKWDMIIAFPPCTYLTVTGNKWNKPEFEKRFPNRKQQRESAINFFLLFANANCEHIAIENPIGIMSTTYKKPTQIIQPFWFGEPERKSTCLWLKGLPKLVSTDMVEPILYTYKDGRTDGNWHVKTMALSSYERAKARSKTFPGIAEAMAEQWGAENIVHMQQELD